MRAIVFLLFVILVFFIVRFTLNRIIQIREQNRQKDQLKQTRTNSLKEEEPQSIVRCAECGIHLPQSEAYYDGKDTFCSEGHMQTFHEKSRNKTQQKTGHSDD